MNARPANGRMRGNHSLSLALSIGVLIAAVAFIVFVVCGGAARAHDATPTAAMPQGWTYPLSCCSGIDCREVPDDWIVEGPDGYRVIISNELIPMSDSRIKRSPDGRFHWCSVAGADDGKTICLFAPPRGM